MICVQALAGNSKLGSLRVRRVTATKDFLGLHRIPTRFVTPFGKKTFVGGKKRHIDDLNSKFFCVLRVAKC